MTWRIHDHPSGDGLIEYEGIVIGRIARQPSADFWPPTRLAFVAQAIQVAAGETVLDGYLLDSSIAGTSQLRIDAVQYGLLCQAATGVAPPPVAGTPRLPTSEEKQQALALLTALSEAETDAAVAREIYRIAVGDEALAAIGSTPFAVATLALAGAVLADLAAQGAPVAETLRDAALRHAEATQGEPEV